MTGNLLVGNVTTGLNQPGINLHQDGVFELRRNLGTANSSTTGYISRGSTDGNILQFYKNTTMIGSIATNGDRMNIGTEDVGLRFDNLNNLILPWNMSTNSGQNNTISLGAVTNYRFADLFLSGGVNVSESTSSWMGIKGSKLGYGSGSYKTTLVGATSGTNNVALGVDMSGNTSGAFSGYGDIFVKNNQGLYQPNAANNDILDIMRWSDSETVFNESGDSRNFRVESNNNTHALFVDGGAERLLIGKSNNVLGASGHTFGLDGYLYHTRNGDIMWLNCLASSGTAITFMQNSATKGSITVNSTGTTYNTTSDRRLKDNIQPITDATDKLMGMNPVTHTWIEIGRAHV
jgi:hypothetical protein